MIRYNWKFGRAKIEPKIVSALFIHLGSFAFRASAAARIFMRSGLRWLRYSLDSRWSRSYCRSWAIGVRTWRKWISRDSMVFFWQYVGSPACIWWISTDSISWPYMVVQRRHWAEESTNDSTIWQLIWTWSPYGIRCGSPEIVWQYGIFVCRFSIQLGHVLDKLIDRFWVDSGKTRWSATEQFFWMDKCQ